MPVEQIPVPQPNQQFNSGSAKENTRPRTLGLLLDVKTRWNSTYIMLKRILDLRPAVEMFIASDANLKDHKLSDREWLLLKEIMGLFKPLFRATIGLSQSKYTSLSLTLPIYMGLVKVQAVFLDEFFNWHLIRY